MMTRYHRQIFLSFGPTAASTAAAAAAAAYGVSWHLTRETTFVTSPQVSAGRRARACVRTHLMTSPLVRWPLCVCMLFVVAAAVEEAVSSGFSRCASYDRRSLF